MEHYFLIRYFKKIEELYEKNNINATSEMVWPIVICTLLVIDLAWPILLDAYYHFSQLHSAQVSEFRIFVCVF